jgi:hypothetical protein
MRCSKCGAENPDGPSSASNVRQRSRDGAARAAKKIRRAQSSAWSAPKPIDSPPADARETSKPSVRVSTVADGAPPEGERKTVIPLFADIKGCVLLHSIG